MRSNADAASAFILSAGQTNIGNVCTCIRNEFMQQNLPLCCSRDANGYQLKWKKKKIYVFPAWLNAASRSELRLQASISNHPREEKTCGGSSFFLYRRISLSGCSGKSLLIKVSLLCSSPSLCGLLQFVAILWSESQFHLLRDLSADPWQTDGQRASGHLLSPVLALGGQLQWGAGGISHDEESLWNGCHRQIGQDR